MFGISYEHFVRWPCHCRGTSGHPGWIYNKNDTNRHGDKQRHRKELLMLDKSILNFKNCKYFKKWKSCLQSVSRGDLMIWKMNETDMTIFMMGETTWPEQYQHLCICGHSLGSALAYWISRKQRWPTNLKVFTHITTLFRVKDYGLVGLGQRWTRENKYLSRTPRWRSSLFIDGHSLLIILPPNVNNHPQWNLAPKKW